MAQMPYKPSLHNPTEATDSEFDSIPATNQAAVSSSLLPPVQEEAIYGGQDVEYSAQGIQRVGIRTNRQRNSVRDWWGGLSVKTKAILMAVILGTTPVVAVGSIAYHFASRSLADQIKRAERDRATQLANEINVFMTDRFADIQLLAQLPIFTNSKVYSDLSKEDKVALLNRYGKLYGVYNSVAFFNLEGDAVLQADGLPVPNHKTRDYFQRVVKTGQPTINPPSISKTTGTLSMHLAAPVKDASTDELKGVVRFQLPVRGLEKIVQEYATNGDQYFLIDSNNKYFLSSGLEARLGKSAGEHFAKYTQLKKAQDGRAVIDVNPDNGSERLLTYVPLNDLAGLPDLDFGVLIATDVNIAFAAQKQLLWSIGVGTVLTALLVASVAAILANRTTRPILVAANAVRKIGQGDLDTRLQFEGTDEIGVLGASINNMAGQLQESLDLQVFEAAQERLITIAKGSDVVRSTDLQAVFDQAIEGARQLFKFDRLVIYRFQSNSNSGIVAESVDHQWSTALDDSISDSCIPEELRAAYQAGRIKVIDNVSTAELHPAHLNLLKRLQVKASLITPITGGDQLYGLLVAHHCSTTHQWQEAEINFLQRLGTELALCIYRVELLEQTTQLAEEQRQLKESLQKRALELLVEVDPISRGDLTTQAKVTADEIGTIADSYNATVENLRRIVLQVQKAANQVATTTDSSQVSIQSLSEEALRQAEAISAALKVAEETAMVVRQVAANTEQAELAVQEAAQSVEEGDLAMNRTVDGIMAIRSTVADTAKKVKHLGESSQKISTVVDLISSFAAQTNMLALNAAIEASRAGEEGKGFAVVADEVRTLARQSAEATEEIRKLVVSIQAETKEVVSAMESGTEQVVIGTQLVNETRQSLNKITTASAQISELVQAIAEATVVQSQASEEVTQTMKDVAEIANKTSVEASQVSSSFEHLRQVAQTLQAEVGQFKV